MTGKEQQKAPDTLHDRSQTSLLTEKLPKVPPSAAGSAAGGAGQGQVRGRGQAQGGDRRAERTTDHSCPRPAGTYGHLLTRDTKDSASGDEYPQQ